jgi:hypothetical protein
MEDRREHIDQSLLTSAPTDSWIGPAGYQETGWHPYRLLGGGNRSLRRYNLGKHGGFLRSEALQSRNKVVTRAVTNAASGGGAAGDGKVDIRGLRAERGPRGEGRIWSRPWAGVTALWNKLD